MTPERRTAAGVHRLALLCSFPCAAVGVVGGVGRAVGIVSIVSIVVLRYLARHAREDGSGSRREASTRGGRGDGTPSARRRRRTADGRDRASLRSTAALVDSLLDQAARQLPLDAGRDRWAEEWADHRRHLRGLRLLWWAWCVRATASRTAAELRHARLPHPDR